MIPIHQIQIQNNLLCQFSKQPINKLCTLHSCKEKCPFICDFCKDSGCIHKHSHNGFKKHIPYQDLITKLSSIDEGNNIPKHLKEVNQQLEKLIGDLEVLMAQHSEILSANQFQYKLKPRASLLIKAIEEKEWDTISGSDLDYLLKEQIYTNKLQVDHKIYFERSRIYKVFDTLRKNIGDYYYEKEKKSIKECLNSAAKKRDASEFEQAILEYTRVLELYPNSQQALCYRGLCHSFTKNYEKALEDYNLCLKIDPRHAQTMSNIGHIFSLKKQKKIALQWYNRSVETDSSNHLTLFNRGLIHMSIGNLQQAKHDFTKALKIHACKQYYCKKARCHELLLQKEEADQCMILSKSCEN